MEQREDLHQGLGETVKYGEVLREDSQEPAGVAAGVSAVTPVSLGQSPSQHMPSTGVLCKQLLWG